MGLMDGKNVLVFGVANNKSIAWGITEALHQEGANIGLGYAGEQLKRRVTPLAESLGITFVEECDVLSDEALDKIFEKAKAHFGKLDGVVHAVAYATREDLEGQFLDTSRQGFNICMNISVFSLVAMAKRALPLMQGSGGILTLSYYGSEKVMPNYNVMGVAKAALEASVRYLSYDLGKENVRINAISAGAIKTLSAAGIPGIRDMLKFSKLASPLGQNVTPEDVGKCALWLLSDWGALVTGQTIYVDAGVNVMGLPLGALEALEDEMKATKEESKPASE